MKKHNRKRIAVNAAAAVLAVCVLTSLLANGQTAAAVTSLPHIESIVSDLQSTTASFDILEIVPQAGSGSIGYYAAGQEPVAQWKTELAAQTSPAARQTYMDALRQNLLNAGLSSAAADAAPLRDGGAYTEAWPWARQSGTTYTTLELASAETVRVTGTFQEKTGTETAGYDYRAAMAYTIVDQTGGYVQNIGHFTPYAAGQVPAGTTYFYYQPAFAQLDMTAAAGWADQDVAVYTWVETPPAADAPEGTLPTGHYVYYDQLENGLERDKTYYYVTATGKPAELAPEGAAADVAAPGTPADALTGWYMAELDQEAPYEKVPTGGWFTLTTTGYTYVGGGDGDYKYDASGKDTQSVTTKITFFTGGFTNNHWFLTKVMDVDADKAASLRVNVTSVTPGEVAGDVLTKVQEGNFQLIVLSNGEFRTGAAAGAYSTGNDLTGEARAALATAANADNKTPVVVDSALLKLSADLNIQQLAAALKGTSAFTGSFVSGNVYVAAAPLATAGFGAPFSADEYKASTGPFYAVYAELLHENALRKLVDAATKDLLSETVSMAGAIRYIINYANQRVVTPKDAFTVLDIEPSKDTALKKSDVLGWFPAGKFEASDVKITTMATAEFIGKIEDVSELYDVVYLGAGTSSLITDYNDDTMDGLVYTNIGDTYRSGYNLSGLLDRDYYGTTKYLDATSTGKANLYRFSGNDLTAKKVTKLQEFAATGYPVIVADSLISDTNKAAETYTLTSTVTAGTPAASSVGLSVAYALKDGNGDAVQPDGVSRQWFQNGTAISGATGSSYTATKTGTYLCKVMATYKEQSLTAVSNAFVVTSVTGGFQAADTGRAAEIGEYEVAYSIRISGSHSGWSGNDTYQISGAPTGAAYQWYKDGSGAISGETDRSLTVDSVKNTKYYCIVTMPDGTTLQSTKARYNNGFRYDSNQTTTEETDVFYTVSVSFNSATGTFTANVAGADGQDIEYGWYRVNNYGYDFQVGEGRTLTLTDTMPSGTYYCEAYIDENYYYDYARSTNWTVTKTDAVFTVTAGAPGVPATLDIPAVVGTRGVNTETVDRNSQVYTLLNSLLTRENVKTAKEAASQKEAVFEALNLSKPKIHFPDGTADYPTVYKKEDNGTVSGKLDMVDGKYYLTYRFQIVNGTDPTPPDHPVPGHAPAGPGRRRQLCGLRGTGGYPLQGPGGEQCGAECPAGRAG